MTLMMQDGKPYRTFSEPNPILKDQVIIEKKQLIFHNFGWEPQVVLAPPKEFYETKEPEPEKEEIKDFLELLKKEKETLKTEAPPETPKTIYDTNTLIVYCHPATVKEYKDDLYGETKKTILFGKKFTFEALFIDSNDLEINLFTKNDISEESIIYPSKYKTGEKLSHYRWWKIKRKEKFRDGFILFGELTEDQRDFSE